MFSLNESVIGFSKIIIFSSRDRNRIMLWALIDWFSGHSNEMNVHFADICSVQWATKMLAFHDVASKRANEMKLNAQYRSIDHKIGTDSFILCRKVAVAITTWGRCHCSSINETDFIMFVPSRNSIKWFKHFVVVITLLLCSIDFMCSILAAMHASKLAWIMHTHVCVWINNPFALRIFRLWRQRKKRWNTSGCHCGT